MKLDELVERVAGEDRRAAALLVQRGALDVGHRGQGEEDAGDQEDDRRQAQRALGDDAEREVDRRSRPTCRRSRTARAIRGCAGTSVAVVARRVGLLATQSRPTPAATKRTPSSTPSDRAAAAGQRRARASTTPITTIAADSRRVAPRWSSRGAGIVWADATRVRPGGEALRARRRGIGLDDHAARTLGEHGLDRLAEHRRRRCARGSGMTIARAPISCASSTISRPRLPGADLLDVPGHAAPALELGLLDDALRRRPPARAGARRSAPSSAR